MEKQKKAYFYAIAAVLCWSTVASAFKLSLRYAGVLPLLFYASIVSTIFLFCLLLATKKIGLLRRLTKTDCLGSVVLGFLNPFLYYVVLFGAYSRLAAQEALTLNFVWPIMLVLLSIPLLGQKIGLKSIAAIMISFFGVFVISTKGGILSFRFTSAVGVLLALGSSLIWALFWIYNVRDKRDDTVKLFLNFAFGSVFVFIAMLLFSDRKFPGPEALFGAFYIGLFEMGLTFFLWMRALNLARTTAYVASLIYLVPFVSIVCIHLVVGEQILLSTIAGLVLIVTGIALQRL